MISGAINGCVVAPQASPGPTVQVSGGSIRVGDAVVSVAPAPSLDILGANPADPSLPRWDQIVVDDGGTLSIVTGTPTAPGADGWLPYPETPTDKSLRAMVYVPAGATVIDNVIATDVQVEAPSVPTGSLILWSTAVAPYGYVLCDGATYDGTQDAYRPLWLVLGTTYGGTGQSAFKVPDLRGRMPVGVGTHADVSSLGASDGLTVGSRRPKHRHTVGDPGHSHDSRQFLTSSGGSNATSGGGSVHADLIASATTGISVGPSGAPLDAPAYLVVNYCIKL